MLTAAALIQTIILIIALVVVGIVVIYLIRRYL